MLLSAGSPVPTLRHARSTARNIKILKALKQLFTAVGLDLGIEHRQQTVAKQPVEILLAVRLAYPLQIVTINLWSSAG